MIGLTYDDRGWTDKTRLRIRSIPASLTEAAEEQLARLNDAIRAGLVGSGGQGGLADAIETEVSSATGGAIASLTCTVPYAAYQNYGFYGTEQVAAHLRSISVVYGRPLATPIEAMVGPSVRQVDYAGTGFMSQPFAESEDAIVAAFDDAIAGAFES